jgi:toxin ParE1/3/4
MTDSRLLPAAQREYDQAVDWYLEKSVSAASRFVEEVEFAIESIRKNPDRYPRWDDEYRYCLLDSFPYYIAYRCVPESVVVVAIRHASRDQDAWK